MIRELVGKQRDTFGVDEKRERSSGAQTRLERSKKAYRRHDSELKK